MKKNEIVSTEKIYFWNILGNLFFSGSSVLFTLIVSRLTSPREADSFSLAYGIAGILVVVAMFQVRTYQGTDVEFKHSFTSYTLARILSLILMILFTFPYLNLSNIALSDSGKLSIILLYVLFRTCEAISDLFQGLFQQHERLDIAGKSMTYRYGMSVLLLFVSLILTKSLEFSLLLLCIVNFLFVFLFDYHFSRQFANIDLSLLIKKETIQDSVSILKNCVPLFISGFLLAYIFNEPRVAIDMEINAGHLREGLQRDYNILFMPVFFMSLFILILRPLTTSLAISWQKREYQQFDKTIQRLFQIILGGGVFLTLLAYFIGTPILSLIFGVDLNHYQITLAILVFSGILYSLGIVLGDTLTIFRRQYWLIPVYALMFLVSKITTYDFVKNQGLQGGAISFLLVILTYLIGSMIVYLFVRNLERKKYVHPD